VSGLIDPADGPRSRLGRFGEEKNFLSAKKLSDWLWRTSARKVTLVKIGNVLHGLMNKDEKR
jgi:hypothetical protein